MWKIGCLLCTLVIIFISCKGKGTDSKLTPVSSMYNDMRNLWLSGLPKDQLTGAEFIGPKEIYVAGMEFTNKNIGDGKNRIFIVGSTTGDASIYFQSNNEEGIGGFISGQSYEHIRQSARKMLVSVGEILTEMKQSSFPDMKMGYITFFALSKNAILYTAQIKEKAVVENKNVFSRFFYDANDILTGFRAVEEEQVSK
jgi:hypothetical protein